MATQNIDVLTEGNKVFPPPQNFNGHIKNIAEYEKLYQQSIQQPEKFWAEIAEKNIFWHKKWDQVIQGDFNNPPVRWFTGGKINACYNCIDRHLNTSTRNKAAIIWEGDNGSYRTFTYQQLSYEVNRFANVLKNQGIHKGDRVIIYLPMIPELVIAMLACARIGAIHSAVFAGFSAQALRDRIQNCRAKIVVTATKGNRGGTIIPLKVNVDAAVEKCPSVETIIVVNRDHDEVPMQEGRDLSWQALMAAKNIDNYCEPEIMDANDPLFILYTSGSTGKPKGIVHQTAGYLVYANLTFKWIFDYHDEHIHFCTADIGWVTGHSYIVYGPLSCGATSLMFEGIPTYPNPDRFWAICDKHKVNSFYTSPTAIRTLMRENIEWINKHDLSSLRILGSVGEPINPEAWIWYYTYVGKNKLPIVDTWWQTETGGILISPLPGVTPLKPGSANKPFFGVIPKIMTEQGNDAKPNEGGYLVIEKPWPGMFGGIYGDANNQKTNEVYFSKYPNKYFTGDAARFDQDSDFWLMGRIDDVINVSGHRLGTAEIESALITHEAVAEAAVVGYPHSIKGDGIYVYAALKQDHEANEELKKSLIGQIRLVIGPIATPDKVQFVPDMPKTRSGKIMRRILRNIARGEITDLGDISTLANPNVVDEIIKHRL